MKVKALSRSKVMAGGCIDCNCRNPECEYFKQPGIFVDGGSANIPSGSMVELKCSRCGFRWESIWHTSREDPNPELVKIHPVSSHLFSGISDEDARKLSDVLIEIYEKQK